MMKKLLGILLSLCWLSSAYAAPMTRPQRVKAVKEFHKLLKADVLDDDAINTLINKISQGKMGERDRLQKLVAAARREAPGRTTRDAAVETAVEEAAVAADVTPAEVAAEVTPVAPAPAPAVMPEAPAPVPTAHAVKTTKPIIFGTELTDDQYLELLNPNTLEELINLVVKLWPESYNFFTDEDLKTILKVNKLSEASKEDFNEFKKLHEQKFMPKRRTSTVKPVAPAPAPVTPTTTLAEAAVEAETKATPVAPAVTPVVPATPITMPTVPVSDAWNETLKNIDRATDKRQLVNIIRSFAVNGIIADQALVAVAYMAATGNFDRLTKIKTKDMTQKYIEPLVNKNYKTRFNDVLTLLRNAYAPKSTPAASSAPAAPATESLETMLAKVVSPLPETRPDAPSASEAPAKGMPSPTAAPAPTTATTKNIDSKIGGKFLQRNKAKIKGTIDYPSLAEAIKDIWSTNYKELSDDELIILLDYANIEAKDTVSNRISNLRARLK